MHTPDMRSKNALDTGYHSATVLRTRPGLRAPRQHAYAEPMHPTRALPSGNTCRRRSGAPQHHLGGVVGTLRAEHPPTSRQWSGRSWPVRRRALQRRGRGQPRRTCLGWDGIKEQGDASPAIRVQHAYRALECEASRWMCDAQRAAARCARPLRPVEPRLPRARERSATPSRGRHRLPSPFSCLAEIPTLVQLLAKVGGCSRVGARGSEKRAPRRS